MAESMMLLINTPFRVIGNVTKDPTTGYLTVEEAEQATQMISDAGAACAGVHGMRVDGEMRFFPCGSAAELGSALAETDGYKPMEDKSTSSDCECSSHTDSIVKGAGLIALKELEQVSSDMDLEGGVIIEGPVSSGVMDRDGDIVDPQAVMRAWDGYKKNPIILHNHQRGGIGRMLDVRMGTWEGLDHEVPIGRALVDGQQKDVVHKIRKGIIRAFSIGFIAHPDGIQKMEDEEGRIIHRFVKIDWVETSVVDIPSNPMALFDVVKNCERVRVKGSAPEFNSPFSMWIFQRGSEMTESEMISAEEAEETIIDSNIPEATEVKVAPENVMDTPDELVDEELHPEDGSDVLDEELPDDSEELINSQQRQIDSLNEKMDAIISHLTKDAEVSDESDSNSELQEELNSLRAEKAAREQEDLIQAEVAKRVSEELAKTNGERVPERKSMVVNENPVSEDAFEALAKERNTTVGAIKGEAWLASLIGSRGA